MSTYFSQNVLPASQFLVMYKSFLIPEGNHLLLFFAPDTELGAGDIINANKLNESLEHDIYNLLGEH